MNFIPVDRIERIAAGDFRSFKEARGLTTATFPLDPEDIFYTLFGLTTRYVDFTEHQIVSPHGFQLLGALYPDGYEFCDEDNQILVNVGIHSLEEAELFPFIEQMQRFTVFHEGGHAALHVRPEKQQISLFPDEKSQQKSEPFLCRSDQITGRNYDPLEFQANRYAAAMIMPADEVFRLIGSDTTVNLAVHGQEFRNHFGVSQKAMEKRLTDLEYKYINGKYDHVFKGKEADGIRK